MKEYTSPDGFGRAIKELRERVNSLERAAQAPATPTCRVCITAAGTSLGFGGGAVSTPWRPWCPVTFTDLRMETVAAAGGGNTLTVTMYANVGTAVERTLGSVTIDGSTSLDGKSALATLTTASVDVHDVVVFKITSGTSPPSAWRGLTVQAIGTSTHPVSAGLVLVDDGQGE